MKCAICSREVTKDSYCELHAKAYESVFKGFDRWKKTQVICWKEYLSEIAKNPLTGEWAREVAEHLMKPEKK